MSEINWHRLTFPCPSCERQVAILEIDAASDGEIAIVGICVSCGKQLTFNTDIRKILSTCVQADILCPMEEDLADDIQ
jgi:predicted RNA-binding Zn-ribbon protein involved in translation (DUF1610 family)